MLASLESGCVEEHVASFDLPHFEHNSAQLPDLERQQAHLLLRVRGTAVGTGQTGTQVPRVRSQVPREVQRPAQRRLSSELVQQPSKLLLCSSTNARQLNSIARLSCQLNFTNFSFIKHAEMKFNLHFKTSFVFFL